MADQRGIEQSGDDAEHHRRQQGQPQYLITEGHGQDHRLAAKGEQRTIGEIGPVQDAVGQHVAKGEQRIERA
jgi:hypothetical protein